MQTDQNSKSGPDLSSFKDEEVELTEGEIIMDCSFKPTGRHDMWNVRRWCAEVYDWLIKECRETGPDLEKYNRKQRCMRVALTHLETFQMSAITSLGFTREFAGNDRYIPIRPAPTEGQIVMRIDHNVEEGKLYSDIMWIKSQCATMYDEMETEVEYRKEDFKVQEKKYYDDWAIEQKRKFDLLPPEEQLAETERRKAIRNFTNPEWSPELILNHRKLQHSIGAMGESFYDLRMFRMFAVKALTR